MSTEEPAPTPAPASGPGRRPWVPVLVALDVVLVAAVLVILLVTRPTGAAPTPGASGTSGVATAAAGTGPAAVATPGPPEFRLPSGNISCAMATSGVTCTIADFTYSPPAVAGCTGSVGHSVVLDAHGVSVPCVEGPAPTLAGQDVPELFYGATGTVGGYTCTSATNGVTCTDAKGVGFRLARATFTTVP